MKALFLIAIFTSILFAEVYVSPSGSDETGDGGITAPYKTIGYAYSKLPTQGGIIQLFSGTYIVPPLEISKSLEIKSYQNSKVKIRSAISDDTTKALFTVRDDLSSTITISFSSLTIDSLKEISFIRGTRKEYGYPAGNGYYLRMTSVDLLGNTCSGTFIETTDSLYVWSLTDSLNTIRSLFRASDAKLINIHSYNNNYHNYLDMNITGLSDKPLQKLTINTMDLQRNKGLISGSSIFIKGYYTTANISVLSADNNSNMSIFSGIKHATIDGKGSGTFGANWGKITNNGSASEPFTLLLPSSSDTIILKNIEFIRNTNLAYPTSTPFMTLPQTASMINCLLAKNTSSGPLISIYHSGFPTIDRSTIYHTGSAAIDFQNNTSPKVERSSNLSLSNSIVEGIISNDPLIKCGLQVKYSRLRHANKQLVTDAISPYYDMPICFQDSANNNFTLAPYSPCIDAGDPQIPSTTNDPFRMNIGAYANSPFLSKDAAYLSDANLILKSKNADTTVLNEVVFDTIYISNGGTVPAYISPDDTIKGIGSLISLVGRTIPYNTMLAPGDSFSVIVACKRTLAGAQSYSFETSVHDVDPTIPDTLHVTYNDKATTNFTKTISFSGGGLVWDWGKLDVKVSKTDTAYIKNNGYNTVTFKGIYPNIPVSAISFIDGGSTATVKAGDSVGIIVTVNTTVAGEFTSAISLFTDNYTKDEITTLAIKGGLHDFQLPVAKIEAIEPKTINWDTAAVVTVTANTYDQDPVGLEPSIVKTVWVVDGKDTLADTDNILTVTSSRLGIGKHEIAVYAIDNEGAVSVPAKDTITVVGLHPYAKIDSIAPRSVIIRNGATVQLKLTAFDRDQFATNEKDDLDSIKWYSTISGLLKKGSKIDSIAPSSLPLGYQGFYAVVTDNEGQVSNSDTVWIPVQNSMGHAIIVTGATFGETSYFMNNIAPNANMAYKRLKNRGFSDEQIFYMNPVSWQSIDGNGLTDSKIVDQTAMTKDNLHAYLTSIAGDIKKDIPLVIYFLGHGNANQQNAKFYINDNEYIDPATLNNWLNEFGDLSANKSYITIILDFCYSGGFVPGLASTTQKRAVITSASAGTTAYFSRGKSFGTAFFNEVYRGKSLKSCFETASLWSEQNAPGGAKANPIMIIDQATADNIFLGGSQNLQSIIAEIDSISNSIYLGNVTITAKCTGKVSSIRCRMIPETFDPKTGSYADLPVTTFTRSGEDTTLWSGIVTYFPTVGNYLLMVEGEDEGANMILPQGIAVKIDNTGIKTMNKPAQLFFGTANIGGSTQLKFGLPETSPVTITIYDLRGRVVNQLVNSVLNAGYYNIPLDNLMGAGMYITRFTAGSKSMTEKVMIQR